MWNENRAQISQSRRSYSLHVRSTFNIQVSKIRLCGYAWLTVNVEPCPINGVYYLPDHDIKLWMWLW